MLSGQLLATAILLAIAALALHLDQLLARRLRAVALVARCRTLVTAQHARLGATLAAQLSCLLTLALVAGLDALVTSTGEGLAACQATTEAGLGAGYRLALLVVAVAPLRGEHHAGRATGRGMAVMLRHMLAAVGARAGSLADGLLGAAGHRWIDDLRAALAVQLLETAPIAGRAVAAMAGLVALVTAAAEGAIAGQWTRVIDVDAALRVALVLATAALLGAAPLAASVVRTRRQLAALDHLVHVATATLHCRLLGTRRTLAQVALAGTLMRMRRLAAAHGLAADALARGHRVETTGALLQRHRQFAARTTGDLGGTQFAGPAGTGMTRILALVVATRQRFAAALLARVAALILALLGAQHLTLLLATVAVLLHLLCARLTLARMADLLAPMLVAIEQLIADGFALQRLLHGALHQLAGASAATTATHIGLTRRTGSRMTEQRAGVAAALDATAELATTVRQLIARQWRILELATEAEILAWQFLKDILAGRTTPALGRLGAARPRDGALEVQHMVAVLARPCAVMCLDLLHAHETLQSSLLNVSHQFLSLR